MQVIKQDLYGPVESIILQSSFHLERPNLHSLPISPGEIRSVFVFSNNALKRISSYHFFAIYQG